MMDDKARTRLFIDPVDIANVADADQLGLPKSHMGTDETSSGPTMVDRAQPTNSPEFQTAILSPGSRIAGRMITRVGGWFGVPKGPDVNHARVAAVRTTGGEAPALLVEVPTGLASTPVYAASYEGGMGQYR
jgi:hypothetical protein